MCTIFSRPSPAAKCRGVKPSLFFIFRSAPFSTRVLTTFSWPKEDDYQIFVHFLFFRRAFVFNLPLNVAEWSMVHPLQVVVLTSAPFSISTFKTSSWPDMKLTHFHQLSKDSLRYLWIYRVTQLNSVAKCHHSPSNWHLHHAQREFRRSYGDLQVKYIVLHSATSKFLRKCLAIPCSHQ